MPDPVQPIDWREFFESHAPYYDQNSFTQNTKVEVQFLDEVLGLEPGSRILDAGCGTGRHAIELALRGYHVTGVDYSAAMLDIARRKADSAGAQVEWIETDLRQFAPSPSFDAAICICEGGPGLLSPGEDAVAHDLSIFRGICMGLKAGSPFVMTALNGYSVIRRMQDGDVERGTFDPATMEMAYVDEWRLPEGPRMVPIRERLFIPTEMVALLHHAGFEVRHVWGGTAGDWGQRPLKLDEIEAMYVSRKHS